VHALLFGQAAWNGCFGLIDKLLCRCWRLVGESDMGGSVSMQALLDHKIKSWATRGLPYIGESTKPAWLMTSKQSKPVPMSIELSGDRSLAAAVQSLYVAAESNAC
jgi:hypothetical protein